MMRCILLYLRLLSSLSIVVECSRSFCFASFVRLRVMPFSESCTESETERVRKHELIAKSMKECQGHSNEEQVSKISQGDVFALLALI